MKATVFMRNLDNNWDQVRIMIVRAKYQSTTPTIAELLEGSSAFASLRNRDRASNFKVYYDKNIILDPYTKGAIRHLTFFRKTNFKVKFTGTAATSYIKNKLWLFAFADQSVEANRPGLAGQIKIYTQGS
jgi:hypothetical protein